MGFSGEVTNGESCIPCGNKGVGTDRGDSNVPNSTSVVRGTEYPTSLGRGGSWGSIGVSFHDRKCSTGDHDDSGDPVFNGEDLLVGKVRD